MPEDTVDYETVAKVLQRENENLRLFILNMQNERRSFPHLNKEQVFSWIADHATLIIIGVSIFVALLSTIDVSLRIARSQRKEP